MLANLFFEGTFALYCSINAVSKWLFTFEGWTFLEYLACSKYGPTSLITSAPMKYESFLDEKFLIFYYA